MTQHRIRASALAATIGLALIAPTSASATGSGGGHGVPGTFVPVGGGYETDTMTQLVQQVQRTARGRTLDILVVPSSYGDAPEDREENLRQAGVRTTQLDGVCEATIDRSRFSGCTTTLLTLLDRKDALNPANSAAFDDRETDGTFILGGDQVLAMQVLANSPAESAMTRAYRRGVVVSGTSAGNAVESRSMITGYTPDGYPETGLQRSAVTIGWGDTLATDDRGLAFGSQRFIFDQHFYQRGRFGRLLNVTAQSAQRYGRGGKLGLGADYATAPVVRDDRTITGVIGHSSTALLDFGAARAPVAWRGADQTLSTRNVLTHLLAPGLGMTYEAARRQVSVNGRALSFRPSPLPRLTQVGRGTLLLGGGANDRADSAALRSFVGSTGGRPGAPVVVVTAGYADAPTAQTAAESYRRALASAGWAGPVRLLVAGRDRVDSAVVRGAAGVIFAGGDQSLIGTSLRDSVFARTVRDATRSAPVVLTDGAMTAAMAERYSTVASPTSENYEDEGIRSFRTDAHRWAPGLGIVRRVSLEPSLTYDYRWGFLYGAAASDRRRVAVGVSERTAIRIGSRGAQVVGERSVVSVDGRTARFGTASNGAIAAAGVWLSTFAAGDRALG